MLHIRGRCPLSFLCPEDFKNPASGDIQVAPLYQGTLPLPIPQGWFLACFWLSATSPQGWLKSCLCCGGLWTGDCCSQGWPCMAGTCVCPVSPTCLSLQKWAPWCEDLLRPSHHLQLTTASISLLFLLLLLLWRTAREVNTHVWKQNSLYVASVAYWHGTAFTVSFLLINKND